MSLTAFLASVRQVASTLLLVSAVTAAAPRALAQAPFSGTSLPANTAQLRLDMQSHAAPRDRGGWVWGLPSVTAGMGGGMELSAGLSATNPRTTTDLTLAAKWSPLAGTSSPVQVAVGALTFIPTGRTPDADRVRALALPYIAATTRLVSSLGDASPLLTVALYGVDRPRAGPFTDRGGAMIGIEQGLPYALARALGADAAQVQASWVSGKTLFGYASGGVTFVSGVVNLSVGYARGNISQFNHGPTVGVGVAF